MPNVWFNLLGNALATEPIIVLSANATHSKYSFPAVTING
jgi:hypothetical protein